MSNYTPPTGGSLSHTDSPNPGDRIAGALSSLERTPPPGWLWALWVSSLPAGRRDPFAGEIPPDAAVIPMGEAEGFDTSPPHYGIVTRDQQPPYAPTGARGPEVFAGYLVGMLSTGTTPEGCMCGACIPTGIPPGLMAYLSEDVATGIGWTPASATSTDPAAVIRDTIAGEVAAARAMREHYIHALAGGQAPAEWHAQALDLTHPGHYMARMSDTGLAAGVCSVLWWGPMLEAGLPHLHPVEVYAALSAGFSYPVPPPYSAAWNTQAEAETRQDGPYSCLLRDTAGQLEEWLHLGHQPWGGPVPHGEVNP